MDLILDNLQLLLVIAGSVAYWLNQRRREKSGESADYDEDGIPENRPTVAPNADAMEEEVRTRRIQEEIRRKIEERRSGGASAPVPPPLREEAPAYEVPSEPDWREEVAPRSAPQPPALDDGVLGRQRALQEQLEALVERRRAALAAARNDSPVTASATSAMAVGTAPPKSGALLRDLRNPESIRRAIILREVLGPPLALR
jgi:hypothetical protein